MTPDDFVPKHQDTLTWVEITKKEFDEWEEAEQKWWIAALNGWFDETKKAIAKGNQCGKTGGNVDDEGTDQ